MSSRIRTENRRASLAQRLALAPYSVWAVIFVAVPLVFVAYYAFTDESFRFTTENLTKFFTAVSTITDDSGATREVHTYLLIFWRSVKLAVISTVICHVITTFFVMTGWISCLVIIFLLPTFYS